MDESQALFTRSSQSSGGEKERGGHTIAHSAGGLVQMEKKNSLRGESDSLWGVWEVYT